MNRRNKKLKLAEHRCFCLAKQQSASCMFLMRRQTLMLLRSLIKTPEPHDRHKLRLVKMNISVATKINISLVNFLCSRFGLNTQRTSGLSLDYLLLCDNATGPTVLFCSRSSLLNQKQLPCCFCQIQTPLTHIELYHLLRMHWYQISCDNWFMHLNLHMHIFPKVNLKGP